MILVLDYSNPKYLNAAQTLVRLDINTINYGWIPFVVDLAKPSDEAHMNQVKDWLAENVGIIAPFARDLETERKAAVLRIEAGFAASFTAITDTNGVSWLSGYESATAFDDAKRLAELAGETEVVYYDANHSPHTLTIADAVEVIKFVAADFNAKNSTRQSLLAQIKTESDPDVVATIDWT